MANQGEIRESRDHVVECFLTRRSRGSRDGQVHTDGNTLCVGELHVAFWHQGIIYLVEQGDFPDTLVQRVQATIRLGNHGHLVAEGARSNGTD